MAGRSKHRIYAEHPYRGFLPSDGPPLALSARRLEGRWRARKIIVRNDTGVYEGGEISIYYDPMIAKLCTHAPAREAAIDAMGTALDEFRIEGINHNIAFLDAIMHHTRFREGRLTTGFIARKNIRTAFTVGLSIALSPTAFRGGSACRQA